MKRLKKHDQQTVNLPGMRWRMIFLCLGLSIVLAGFSMPWIDTVVLQVQDMAAMVTQVERHIDESVLRAVHANGKILPVRRAFQSSADTKGDRPDFESFRSMDPENGLYWYLDLLTLLRARESAASQPSAGDGEVLERLHRLQIAPPARIYLSRQRKIAEAAYRKAGLSVRRSAFEADRARYRFGYLVEKHRPVLRELADRLMKRGTIWRESGRADDARIAFLAVIRLMVDLIDDSPLPDVTLLAAEGLPKALAAIGGDDEAHRVEDFRQRWHARALNDRVNLLPLIGDFAMAPSAHRRVLRSFCAGGLSIGTWLTLLTVSVLLLLLTAITRMPSDANLNWRWTGFRALVLPLMAGAPLLLLLLAVATIDLHFTWLFSLKSLPAVLLWPALIAITIGLTTYLSIRPATPGRKRSMVPVYIAVLLLVLAVLGSLLIPIGSESWRPPVAVQLFRRLGFLIGAACSITIVAWIMWALLRRGRTSLPPGVCIRGALRVSSASLLFVTVVSLIALGINHANDRAHRQAFIQAWADPLKDSLGDGWYQEHFKSARDILNHLAKADAKS